MSQIVEHLADLTGFRDRGLLDIGLVRALNDLLVPHSITMYWGVGDPGCERWLVRARMDPGTDTVVADPLNIDLEALPPLDSNPARRECWTRGTMIVVGETPQTTMFPISTGSKVIGVLELETLAPIASSDCLTVSTVLRIIGNVHGLLDHSERDALTGLLNRQTFDATFMKGIQPAPAEGKLAPLRRRNDPAGAHTWLGVVDIDHFKRVNDTYGHLIGDEVLLLLSRLMRANFRLGDTLYRFGGEEFVVLLACQEAHLAALAFERLRSRIEHHRFPQVGAITVSIGCTRIEPMDSPSGAFSRGDKALYYVKSHGRNQVAFYDDLVRAGHLAAEQVDSDIELF